MISIELSMSTLAITHISIAKLGIILVNAKHFRYFFYFEHKSHESHKSFQCVLKKRSGSLFYIFFLEREGVLLFFYYSALFFIRGVQGGFFLFSFLFLSFKTPLNTFGVFENTLGLIEISFGVFFERKIWCFAYYLLYLQPITNT